ncbi:MULTISPECIES: hypothetical protein [Sphingobacterium]|nr:MULTISPECIES: hypothetical protein [Sphingobacterium]
MNGIILARKLKAELDIEVIYMSGDNRSTIGKMIEGEFEFIQ